MKKFKYSARSNDGQSKKGEMEAANRTDVVKILQDQGLIVVSVDEKISPFSSITEINIGGVPIDEKVVFMRQLATMMSSGLPLTQSMEILTAQASNPKFKKVLTTVLKDIEGGNSLSVSFKKHPGVFDDIVLNLMKAGEDSGKLEEVFLRLADELEHQRDFQAKIKSAMIYPLIISIVIVGVVAAVMLFMIPSVADIYSEFGGELPFVTRIMVAMSDFSIKYWWVVLIVMAGLVVGGKYYLESDSGKKVFHRLQLKAPIFGPLMIKIQLAQFTQTLNLLIESGIPILDALDLVSDSLSNVHFKEAVKISGQEVEKGSSLAIPLSRREEFPLIVSQMIGVGEETGRLDEVLKKMAEYYNNEVKMITDNLTSIMEPVMLVVMGGVIGFIAVAVYTPLFSLANLVQ